MLFYDNFFGFGVSKKKSSNIVKDISPPLTMTGLALGSSLLGGAMPGTTGSALTKTGSVVGKTVSPLVALSVVKIGGREILNTNDKIHNNKNAKALFGM